MSWSEIRAAHPNKWLIVEALEAQMKFEAKQLDSERIRLEPHREKHFDRIRAHASDADIWRYMPAALKSGV